MSRRHVLFIGLVASAAGGLAGRIAAAPAAGPAVGRGAWTPVAPVCGWHADQPYHDGGGEAFAYAPPAGLRGAVVLADLDEVGRRFLTAYL